MTLDIQQELTRLPHLSTSAVREDGRADDLPSPIHILSKQGRLIMRLSASAEGLNQTYQDLARQLAERDNQIETLTEAMSEGVRHTRQVALTAIQMLDALDWVHESLRQMDQDTFAHDVEAAQRDCIRRLANVGITELPTHGPLDGNLHEGLDTTASTDVPKYHIVKVIRRGFQSGQDILRRAGVVTSI